MSHPQPDSADHDMAHNSAQPFAKSAKGWGSLAGELILTFLKTDKPKTVDTNKPFDVEAAIVRILDETSNGTVYGEYLLNRVVVEAWQSGALGSLNINRTDFAGVVGRRGWSYEDKAHQWRAVVHMSVHLLCRLFLC